MRLVTAVREWFNRAVPKDPPFAAVAASDTVSARRYTLEWCVSDTTGLIRSAAKAPTLIDLSEDGVWRFFVITDKSQAVLYRSAVTRRPRLSLMDEQGEMHECGDVVAPQRFGPTGTTKAEFAEWVDRFATYVQEEER